MAPPDRRSAAHCTRWRALCARHPTPPIAVAIPGARLAAAGVVIAPQRVSCLAFQCFLDDQPRRQPDELRTLFLDLASAIHQRSELFACPLGCRYPVHRGAPSLSPVAKPVLVGFAYQAKVHPNPFSSKLTTSPCSAPRAPLSYVVKQLIKRCTSSSCSSKTRLFSSCVVFLFSSLEKELRTSSKISGTPLILSNAS